MLTYKTWNFDDVDRTNVIQINGRTNEHSNKNES